ncbi:acyl-CoA dehydratase activase [Caldicellulosiruptoraceae bacterium PP1]
MKECYLGVDIGSVSVNVVLLDNENNVFEKRYVRTEGKPIQTLQKTIIDISKKYDNTLKILGCGTTGSGRHLASVMLGADVVKNEITAHAKAAINQYKNVKTIIEIGGQDSKIIIIRNGIVIDFSMNTVCAAGTGSFLDRQAERLNIPINQFGEVALKSKNPVRIAGRCAVFAESDMIHKQQLGHKVEDILYGLCQALARNYISNVAKGKQIEEPIIFQGGVAANLGMKKAFEELLNTEIIILSNFDVMGAIGAAILAKEKTKGIYTNFYGFDFIKNTFDSRGFECKGCSNYCEVINILNNNKVIAIWGDRCGKWSNGKQQPVENIQ